jgi:hypothetical protein
MRGVVREEHYCRSRWPLSTVTGNLWVVRKFGAVGRKKFSGGLEGEVFILKGGGERTWRLLVEVL